MATTNLPPMITTSTMSTLEVNLRRLMAKCDAKVRSSDKILQGSERTKYTMNIQTLKEMLADLEYELTKKGLLDKAAMKEYTDKVDSLANVIEGPAPLPLVNKTLVQARAITPIPQAVAGSGVVSGDAALRRTSQLEPEQHTHQIRTDQTDYSNKGTESSPASKADELLGLRERRHHNNNNRGQQHGRGTSHTHDSARDQRQIEAALQNDRAHREEMEAGLSMLMQQLRNNALAIHQTLADEQKSGLLSDADQALDNNISRLGKERTRLELYSKQSRKTMWMIWGIILSVSIVFVVMFFIIRIF
ncbi:MAG: vesicle transport protein [Benniella sp.]|nr:MAG: vesicle transport protein [Benniella sp.]